MIEQRLPAWWPHLAVFTACALVVGAMFLVLFQRIALDGDYKLHLDFARLMERRGSIVTERPGFEAMTIAVSHLFASRNRLVLAAIWISVAAMVAKFGLSAFMLEREVGRERSLSVAFALLFLAPITLDWRLHPLVPIGMSPVVLGQMSGFIFHSPTTVLVFPFSLLLFYCSFRERHGLAGLLAAAQCLIKPNFVAAWMPAFALLVLWRHGPRWRPLARSAVAVVPALGVLLFQFMTTERLGDGMIVAPFRAWRVFSDNILWSIVRSLAFPLVFCAVYFREIRGSAEHWFAWGIFFIAFWQYALLYITGPVYFGNWTWGRHLSIYIVFLLCLGRFVTVVARPESWRGMRRIAANVGLIALLALHFTSGLRYYLEGVWYGRW
jgi:hypothetical protein